MGSYLGQLGTDSLRKQQLEAAWMRLGVDMEIDVENEHFDFTLTGREAQLEPALRLLAHFLRHAKADDKALKDLKQSAKVNDKSFGKEKDAVLKAALSWALYGQQSDYLRQPSVKETKNMTNEDLLALFDEVLSYDCELLYCGRLAPVEVAQALQRTLPLHRSNKAHVETYRKIQEPTEDVVYFFHVPKSRQNYVVSVESTGPAPTWPERVTAKLWSNYMGGGMSSVLFQNVREFRSLAYSTGGILRMPNMVRHPQDPMAYVTITGTQADKTRTAMHTVDSLLHHMPMNVENIEAARQEMLSDVQNAYPSFRDMAEYIADQRLSGCVSDPQQNYVEQVPAVTQEQIARYHQQHVAPNKRAWIVIGDRKKTDFDALEKYGKVVNLSKADVWR